MSFFEEYKKGVAEYYEVKDYVLKRPLYRPKTNVFTVIIIILIYGIISFFSAYGIIELFCVNKLKWLVYFGIYLVNLSLCVNYICIKIVECYQHYASEERRRKCVCKPTCSEYAIAVLWKYNIFKALKKIHVRLHQTCKGDYKIDLP